jgi:predicted phosphoribosyltransferase
MDPMGSRRRRPYTDRDEAGRVLAQHLGGYAGRDDVVVVGLPRGGVPVAARVAETLGAPLDVLMVRKLGVPWHPELAMGAIAGVAGAVEVVRNERVLSGAGVSREAFEAVLAREAAELRRREAAYRQGRAGVPVRGRVVILVDDGLATGATMRAGLVAVRRGQPAGLVVAVPVGSAAACRSLRADAGAVVCAWTPEPFVAVGHAYRDFDPTGDDEVRAALAAAAQRDPPRG